MIADRLHLSVSAVSKALQNSPNISQETIERVRTVAEELNYQPNSIAKSLRMNETRTIGLVVSDSTMLFFAGIIEAVERTAADLGYHIILSSGYSCPDREMAAVRTLASKRIDGLLLAASMLTAPRYKPFLDSLGVPYIFLVRPPVYEGSNTIINDNLQGAFQIVDYLVRTGSTRIHMINIDQSIPTHKARYNGYRTALEHHGLVCDDSLVSHVKPTIEDGYSAVHHLLASGEPVRAIFCGCDILAVGAMECILGHNLSIPGDIRVAGYDDIEFAAYLRVPLTTVRQPRDVIGRIGTEKLVDLIRGTLTEPVNVVIQPELIVRHSA